MNRPAKTAKRAAWIEYADHLEGATAGAAEVLRAENARLKSALDQRTRSLKQLQRRLRGIG